ncbi:MAG TPA: hypothetical protein VGO93_30800 [Candidatus Xenobia bacterium]
MLTLFSIPRGNILFEHETLSQADVEVMVQNLEQQAFTGYVRTDTGPQNSGYIFYHHGTFVRAFEMPEGNCQVVQKQRILNRLRGYETPTSVYVMSAQMIGVLSAAFSFQRLFVNVEAKKKEIKRIRDGLEQEEQSGMMEFVSRDGTTYALVDRGKLVYDTFAREYGQVLCGLDELNRAFDQLGRDGGYLNVYGEKHMQIEQAKRVIDEELEKTRPLIARVESGIFKGSDDVVKIDEFILKEWGIKGTGAFPVELETPTGEIRQARCQAAKKMQQFISISKNLLKQLNMQEGEVVNVRPVR